MQVETTPIPGLLVLTPRRFADDRGFFSESWNRRVLADQGIETDFVQDNHSLSHLAGTVRGLHYQAPPSAQAKLVRCGRGRLYDVAVDIRKESPTYGQWYGRELSFENGEQLYIPEGFLHGFATLDPMTEVVYKCSGFYDRDADGSVLWSSLGIDWRVDGDPILSEKDAAAPAFDAFESPFCWRGA